MVMLSNIVWSQREEYLSYLQTNHNWLIIVALDIKVVPKTEEVAFEIKEEDCSLLRGGYPAIRCSGPSVSSQRLTKQEVLVDFFDPVKEVTVVASPNFQSCPHHHAPGCHAWAPCPNLEDNIFGLWPSSQLLPPAKRAVLQSTLS